MHDAVASKWARLLDRARAATTPAANAAAPSKPVKAATVSGSGAISG